MKIGNYNLYAIETGRFALDGGAMFGVVPKVLWSKSHPADEFNRIEMTLRSLLIVDENRRILVDTGIGDKYNEKFEGIYNIDQSNYNLKGSLANYGFSPADITDVIITHLHFDHVGGSTYLEGDQAKPTFPNATYFIQKAQWDWAHNPSERDQVSFFKENFDPLQKAGQLKLLDGDCQLYPGVQIMVVEGHTPGQQLVKVSDGKTTLVYCGDLIPLASQVHIPYMMSYDLFPTKTLEEKKKFLAQADEERWILFFEHDPLVEAARIKQVKKGYTIDEKLTLN